MSSEPNFSVVHTFRAAPHVVAEAMLDPALPGFLREHHEMIEDAASEEHRDDGALVQRRVRYRPRPFLERLGPKKIPPEYLAFVEETTFDRRSLTGSFENRALRAAVRRHLVNRGTVTLREAGEGRTERRIEGVLELVALPPLLRPLRAWVHRVLRAEAERLLEIEARCLEAFIARRATS
jgi:hypothetical protein